MIDAGIIERIFRNQDRYLQQLRSLATYSATDLAGDPIGLGAAKYYLQVSIECCIDVANHLIARQGWRAPQSYGDAFTVLEEEHVLSATLAAKTRRMVGMRNRLVHLYWEIDAEILASVLHHNLEDFALFQSEVATYLRGGASPVDG